MITSKIEILDRNNLIIIINLSVDNIRKLHNIDLQIAKEVVAICQKYNLTYYMIGGTLLGAIRHKGFIPWDDDIDFGMPRDDYERFLEVAPSEFSQHLEVVNYKTDSAYQYYITRIRNKNTKVIETRIGNSSKYTNASIDIFPLDGSPNIFFFRKLYYFRVMFHRAIMSLCYRDSIDPDRKRSIQEKVLIGIMTQIPIYKLFDPNKQKFRIDKIMRKNQVDKSHYIGCLMGAYRTREMMPLDYYGKGVLYDFEDIKLNGPEKYNEFLTDLYGDYMQLPPEDSRKTHFKIIEINGENIE